MEYIDKTYGQSEPILISELPYSSKDALKQELKKLADEGKLIRLYNGVYYKPYKTILGTDGQISINKLIEKKYLLQNEDTIGFICGLGLYNKYGFTTQIPSVIEIMSDAATTRQRKMNIDDYIIIIYKPYAAINKYNVNELEFLTLMTDIDKYSELTKEELRIKLWEYIVKKKINFDIVKKYLSYYPDRVYKNLYNGGLMNELV